MLKRLLFMLSFPVYFIFFPLWLVSVIIVGPIFYIITSKDYVESSSTVSNKWWSYFDGKL